MANSNTEHSKKLRNQTSMARVKRLLESGVEKQFGVRMATAEVDRLNAILAEIGGTKAQALKVLCDIYEAYKAK